MGAVHTLVAEVFADFVHTFKTAHDETLEIKFGGDAAIHLLIERVEVRDEGARRCTAGNVLQRGGFHLRVSCFVEDAAEGSDGFCTLVEGVLHLRIDHEVDVATAIAQFRIGECVEHFTVLLLRHGERFEALGEEGDFAGVNRDFACFCAEHVAFDTDKIAKVEQFLHERVVRRLVLFGANLIAADVDLDASTRVEQFEESGFAHHAASHHATGHAHLARRFLLIVEVGEDVVAESVGGIFGGRIGVDAQGADFVEGVAACNFLFAEFEDIHKGECLRLNHPTRAISCGRQLGQGVIILVFVAKLRISF